MIRLIKAASPVGRRNLIGHRVESKRDGRDPTRSTSALGFPQSLCDDGSQSDLTSANPGSMLRQSIVWRING
jgi:hypothetical protein